MRYSDTGPLGTAPPDPTIAAELDRGRRAARPDVAAGARRLAVDARRTPPSWDGQTLESWVEARTASRRASRRCVPLATRPIFGAEPRELSLLFVLFYIAASGNEQNPGTFERNFDTRGGAQQSRFVGGSQTIALKGRGAAWRPRRAELAGAPRSCRAGPARPSYSDRLTVNGQARDRGDPADAGRADRLRAATAVRARPADPALRQGTLTKVAAVYRRRSGARNGLTGAAARHRRTGQRHVRRLAAGRVARTSLFGFVGGDNARSYTRCRPPSARRRC